MPWQYSVVAVQPDTDRRASARELLDVDWIVLLVAVLLVVLVGFGLSWLVG